MDFRKEAKWISECFQALILLTFPSKDTNYIDNGDASSMPKDTADNALSPHSNYNDFHPLL
ncbi:MAG: hypothetical protein K8R77_07785, partial [Anaerolineaceae bacterium]|nr:hypothetical protein [Anaerolineaceae bacterium]